MIASTLRIRIIQITVIIIEMVLCSGEYRRRSQRRRWLRRVSVRVAISVRDNVAHFARMRWSRRDECVDSFCVDIEVSVLLEFWPICGDVGFGASRRFLYASAQ